MANPIVIFDSGVGGLSIYQEVKRTLPSLNVVYCSDTEAFPYGPKSENDVIVRTSYCLGRLAERFSPSLAVIACNTASTISLPRVRRELGFPVVGVVPAIKTASQVSRNRCIGLLATPGTIERSYTTLLISDFADDCTVIKVGSSELVQLAEQHLRNETVSLEQLAAIIEPFFTHHPAPDAIVLGCTHFPLLRGLLKQVAPTPVNWVDSGPAIARRVKNLLGSSLESGSSDNNNISQPPDRFLHTGSEQFIAALVPALKAMGFSQPDYL
ncbi:MAG: glutamate racemase [Endozoicomonas sp.]